MAVARFGAVGAGFGGHNGDVALGIRIGRSQRSFPLIQPAFQGQLGQVVTQSVCHFHRNGLQRKPCGRKPFRLGGDNYFAGFGRTADQRTVDAAFHRKVHIQDMIVLPLCDTAAPFGLAFQGKADRTVIQRTASAVLVHNFHLKQGHVGSVCVETFGVLYGGKFQTGGFPHC